MGRFTERTECNLSNHRGETVKEYPKIRKYLMTIENELTEIEPRLKKSIIQEIRGHLYEKVEDLKKSKNILKLTSKQIENILKDFGEPKEISNEYLRQLSEERLSSHRKGGLTRKSIIAIIIIILLVISLLIPFFNIINVTDDNGNEGKIQTDTTIYPGIGLKNIQIGDGYDKIIDIYGEPENKVVGTNTIGLSYNEQNGMDFLLRKETEKIIEIRFNLGYEGTLENGIKIGSDLEEVLNKSSGVIKTIQANVTETQFTLNGTDRVLYEEIIDGDVVAYKFVDAKRGILYWFNKDKKVTQIVVFDSF